MKKIKDKINENPNTKENFIKALKRQSSNLCKNILLKYSYYSYNQRKRVNRISKERNY